MTSRLRWLLSVLLVLLLPACMSVPLRTMWKLHSFGPDDFVSLDPSALRVAVALDHGCKAVGAVLTADARPASSAQSRRFHFDLRPAMPDTVLDSPGGQPGFWRLATTDLPAFRRLQALIDSTHRKHQKMHFELSAEATHLKCPGGMRRVLHLWVYLRLGADKPYMTLLDGAKLSMPKAFPAGHAPAADAVR